MHSKKLTVAQATIQYLKNQYVERDEIVQPFLQVVWVYLDMEM